VQGRSHQGRGGCWLRVADSSNPQSEKDRIHAEHDYEVKLKAELEIMLLHDKIDQLRERRYQ